MAVLLFLLLASPVVHPLDKPEPGLVAQNNVPVFADPDPGGPPLVKLTIGQPVTVRGYSEAMVNVRFERRSEDGPAAVDGWMHREDVRSRSRFGFTFEASAQPVVIKPAAGREPTLLFAGPGEPIVFEDESQFMPHSGHTFTTLTDGRILLAGGLLFDRELRDAWLFDPRAKTWKPTGAMRTPRWGHTAVEMIDGRVLVCGGVADGSTTADCELFDPLAETWRPAAPMNQPRHGHAAVPLPDGRVLVIGSSSSEVFDPRISTWGDDESFVPPSVFTAPKKTAARRSTAPMATIDLRVDHSRPEFRVFRMHGGCDKPGRIIVDFVDISVVPEVAVPEGSTLIERIDVRGFEGISTPVTRVTIHLSRHEELPVDWMQNGKVVQLHLGMHDRLGQGREFPRRNWRTRNCD